MQTWFSIAYYSEFARLQFLFFSIILMSIILIVITLIIQGENIMLIDLDMPNRTTRDYDGPQVAPKIQAALDAALMDEEDIDIEGGYVMMCLLCIQREREKGGMTYK